MNYIGCEGRFDCPYEQLERDGFLVTLPCKVGDTVYYHNSYYGKKEKTIVTSSEIKQISINSHGTYLVIEYCNTLDINDFGKTVFLTKQAAEKALEGLKI